jgi:hypothetical protein
MAEKPEGPQQGLELFVRMSEIWKTAIPSTLLREGPLLPFGSNLITPPRISGGSAMPILSIIGNRSNAPVEILPAGQSYKHKEPGTPGLISEAWD